MMEGRLFFEFMQVAIGIRESVSVSISDADWHRLFDFCKKQSLVGVGFTAVEKLHAIGVVCPAKLRMQWMALALQIENRNALLNEQCKKLTEQYGHDGLSTCILKGQGNCLNYPEELRNRRQCGDIDVWTTLMKDERLRINDYIHTEDTERHGCPQADYLREQQLPAIGQQLKEKNIDPLIAQMNTDGCPQADVSSERELPRIDREFKEIGPQADGGIAIAVQTGREDIKYVTCHGHRAVIEYVRMQFRLQGIDADPKACYHHIEAPSMDGTEVEVHYRPAFLRSPVRNWRMQRWFRIHSNECMNNRTHLGFSMMTASVNVVYQMCHLYTHVFEGGIGLRQLMDYYFALRVWHNDVMECKDLQTQGMWSEGLGKRVMSKCEVFYVLKSFGMGKFAGAVMWVLREAFVGANENEKNPQINTDGHRCPQADGRSEREFTRINRELKENNIYPQMNTDGHGEILINDERLMINDCPWMICEPNEKEGRRLLAEIMQGGNFGQYDNRDVALKNGGMMKHGVWKLKRVMRLVRSYPEEALWEPVFRVWHLVWRKING